MFEVVFELLLNFKIVSCAKEPLNLSLNHIGSSVGLTKLKLSHFLIELLINRFLNALYTLVYKRWEIARVEVESFRVLRVLTLVIQAVVFLQMEYFLEV